MVSVVLDEVSVSLSGHPVLRELCWELPEAGRTLLAGVNGAGKTTLLRVVAGALRPGGGRVLLDGRPAGARTLRERVALMPQAIRPVAGLTVLDQVAFAGWLAGLPEPAARRRAADVLDLVDLGELRGRRTTRLSGGQLRRVGLAEALVRPADLLLLDEPTAGLDPVQRAGLRDVLGRVERPVVVSTHQLDDIHRIFTRVAVLADGRVTFTGTTPQFLDRGGPGEAAQRAETAFLSLAGAR